MGLGCSFNNDNCFKETNSDHFCQVRLVHSVDRSTDTREPTRAYSSATPGCTNNTIKMRVFYLLLGSLISNVWANVEKTIFLGPPAISIPTVHPNLDDLSLIPLSPSHLSVRTRLNASFPTRGTPSGSEHWLLLDGLSPGARYEVRICWLATVSPCLSTVFSSARLTPSQQPTAFSLETFTLTDVFNEPALIGSLTTYAYAREAEIDDQEHQKLVARRAFQSPVSASATEIRASILFLRIFAAADYYTRDKWLMDNVPPVLVDVILDPYILNIFPISLLPTASYILAVAVASWLLSGYVWKLVEKLVFSSAEDGVQQDNREIRKTK
jgi:hypothetical protein